ncbi:MAG: signal recognition particle protein [Phycisphaerae bacterium]|nr:signal recognition particle protein [Phycisphaerae bacterium]
MFDRLSDSFNGMFRKLSGKGQISEANVREAMEEVRTALLEADVHYDVVQSFCETVLEDAIGREVTKSLKPGQEMIGIVNERLVELLGGETQNPGIMAVSPGPTVIMMCGLQGSGKTTTCGKLAALLKKQGRKVTLVAADLQRPAAVDQLETVTQTVNQAVPKGAEAKFYGEHDKAKAYGEAVNVAVQVCKRGIDQARKDGADVAILDTAGRLHVNEELMGELRMVEKSTTPHHIFFVVDAMTGQDAVASAKAFNEKLKIDGVILTKLDSDARGGAALSVKEITGAPIRYIGVGEKIDAIETFHAERMAGRILGMGDVVSLVEKAQEEVTEEEAQKLQAKLARGEMDMNDFLKQLKTLRRMGPMKQLLGMLPGVGSAIKDLPIDEGQFDRVEAMINSMTAEERQSPKIIGPPRRRRIASGSGSEQQAVGGLVKQFDAINKISKQMAGMGAAGGMDAMRGLGAGGGMPDLGGMLRSKGSTKQVKRGVKKRKKKR